MYEIDCEYSYSNPTGMFNLSCPEKMSKKGYTELRSYREHLNLKHEEECDEVREAEMEKIIAAKHAEKIEMTWLEKNEAKLQIPVPEMRQVLTKPWSENKQVGPVLLRVEVTGLYKCSQEINVQLTRDEPEKPSNMLNLAVMPYFKKLWSSETDTICHVVKRDPSKPFDKISMEVNKKEEEVAPILVSATTGLRIMPVTT